MAAIPNGVAALLLTLLIVEAVVRLPQYGAVWIGHDYRLYMDATREWLAGGTFYRDYQLAGPYSVVATEILYPPVALWLFVPFTVLPAVAWWAPVGIVSWIVWQQGPGPWQRVAILSLLAFPIEEGTSWAVEFIGNGNPGMWVAAFVALATRHRFFGSWALIKPTLASFTLVGIREREWWYGAAALLAASVTIGMWDDYLTVVRNAEGVSLLYSTPNMTLCLIPLVAWLARSSRYGLAEAKSLDGRSKPTVAQQAQPSALRDGRRPTHNPAPDAPRQL